MRELTDYELSTEYSRIDWQRVQAWLASSYWTPGISLERVKRAAENSALVIGAFLDREQVAYARVVSDRTRFAYLCDVWVDERHRGKGLASRMVKHALEHPEFATVKWAAGHGGRASGLRKAGIYAVAKSGAVDEQRGVLRRKLRAFRQEPGESLEIVRINQIDASRAQDFPGFPGVRRGPKTDDAALGVDAVNEILELLAFGFRKLALAPPLKMGTPVVADERHEGDGEVLVQVREAAIVGGQTIGFTEESGSRAVAAQDDRNGVGVDFRGGETSQNPFVTGQGVFQSSVSALGFSLNIDQQDESGTAGRDSPAIFFGTVSKRIEIKALQSSRGIHLFGVMSDEELSIRKMDVGLNTAESLGQRIKEWADVFVVIVSMRARQRFGRGRIEQSKGQNEQGCKHRVGVTGFGGSRQSTRYVKTLTLVQCSPDGQR
jgi:GNAT superfamily N-acetyltransferase